MMGALALKDALYYVLLCRHRNLNSKLNFSNRQKVSHALIGPEPLANLQTTRGIIRVEDLLGSSVSHQLLFCIELQLALYSR